MYLFMYILCSYYEYIDHSSHLPTPLDFNRGANLLFEFLTLKNFGPPKVYGMTRVVSESRENRLKITRDLTATAPEK